MVAREVEVYDAPPEGGKDYILQVKVKNGPLLRAIRMRGYRSAKEFSDKNNLVYTTVCHYLALTQPPISKRKGSSLGGWNASALAMAKALGLPPFSLFPPDHLEYALPKSSAEIEVSREEIALLIDTGEQLDSEQQIERDEARVQLTAMLTTLKPREERVLRMRFGLDGDREMTLDEVGERYGVTGQRIREIEAKALRQLRHPSRSRMVAELSHDLFGYDVGRRWHKKARPKLYVPEWKRPAPDVRTAGAPALPTPPRKVAVIDGWPVTPPRRRTALFYQGDYFILDDELDFIYPSQLAVLREVGRKNGMIRLTPISDKADKKIDKSDVQKVQG